MADNITLNAGSGGSILAADDVGSVFYQRVKLVWSADGSAGELSKAEDVAHSSGDHGIPASVVRKDTAASLCDTDGDYTFLEVDANGRLHVLDQNSAGMLTALQIIDDWDESDRAKVNIIAGQAGIAAGAGAVGATVPRVTLASDDPGVALLTTIDADTGAIKTAVELIDNAISGSEMQVDVVAALPAGTNAIGKLAANTGVDIGDVDVLTCGTITPGTAAANLGKAVDSAGGATDTGVAMLAIRDDESAALTPADGDYVRLRTDKFGHLHVTLKPDATSAPKYAKIDAASSGDNTLIAAAGAGVKIRVTAAMLVAAGTVTVRFEDGAGGTALTGQMNCVANSGFTLPYNPDGWFETSDNTLLNLELSAAVSVDGCLTYVEV